MVEAEDAFGEEITEVESPLEEIAPADEGDLDWEALAEELGAGGEAAIAEATPSVEGDLLSGDDALAWLESLTTGKEDELRAQAEVEAQARVDEILGRKPATAPTAEPVVEAPAVEPVVEAEGAFGWDAFGEEITEVEPAPEEGALSVEGMSDWETLAEELSEPGDAIETEPISWAQMPTGEDDLLSGDDALAWLESLTLGKEEELRAQAEIESRARVDEILGRKPAVPAESTVDEVPVVERTEIETENALTIEEIPSDEGAFGWDAFGEEITEVVDTPSREAVPALEGTPSEESTLDWEVVAEELSDEAAPVETVPTAEGDLLSGDDALAWLESLTLGKEEELRAQTEIEAQARVNEILGRKPEAPIPSELAESEPASIAEEPAIAQTPMLQPAEVLEAPSIDLEALSLDALRDHVRANAADHAARLTLARALRDNGEIEEALEHYTQLVQADAEMQQVMTDLKQATIDYPQDTQVLQTLGDAYMAQDMVDQALEIYNQAMNLL